MTISLDSFNLPNGLRWIDEFDWRADTTSTEYSLTGSLVVDRATKQAGRPVTLEGGADFCWITRAQLITLQGMLESYLDTGMTLTLHDSSTLDVIPASDTALQVKALPIVKDSGPADPSNTTKYILERLRLITI